MVAVTSGLHKDATGTNVHTPISFSYADSTAREGATGLLPGDVGKFARQLDDNSIWMLTDDDPVTWSQVNGTGGSGGTPGLVHIETKEVTGSPGILTFTGIPTGYKDLLFQGVVRGTQAAGTDQLRMTVGSGSLDTGSNYAFQIGYRGGSAGNVNNAGTTSLSLGIIPSASEADADDFGVFRALIYDYLSTSRHRGILIQSAHASSDFRSTEGGGRWKNKTSAIDTVSFFGLTTANLAVGSKISLYGMR